MVDLQALNTKVIYMLIPNLYLFINQLSNMLLVFALHVGIEIQVQRTGICRNLDLERNEVKDSTVMAVLYKTL